MDGVVSFYGTYGKYTFTQEDTRILFLGGSNQLYYPQVGASIGACRAYFQLLGNITAGEPASEEQNGEQQIKAFNLNFDDGETTGIKSLSPDPSPSREGSAGAWYSLDGRKLSGKPTHKGLYINGGRKVVIK